MFFRPEGAEQRLAPGDEPPQGARNPRAEGETERALEGRHMTAGSAPSAAKSIREVAPLQGAGNV